MDSLTRVAHARREIGLALGEQPTSKGYPPSVVSLIPSLIERSGTGLKKSGSITSFYTVLADGDDANDPVVDAARAILDGHILLSRQQTQLGIYPAIDVPASVSRVMNEIVTPQQTENAVVFRRLVSLYLENRDLILMGGYSQVKILILILPSSFGLNSWVIFNSLTMRNLPLRRLWPGFRGSSLERHNEF